MKAHNETMLALLSELRDLAHQQTQYMAEISDHLAGRGLAATVEETPVSYDPVSVTDTKPKRRRRAAPVESEAIS